MTLIALGIKPMLHSNPLTAPVTFPDIPPLVKRWDENHRMHPSLLTPAFHNHPLHRQRLTYEFWGFFHITVFLLWLPAPKALSGL
jgi:hypothetical protein